MKRIIRYSVSANILLCIYKIVHCICHTCINVYDTSICILYNTSYGMWSGICVYICFYGALMKMERFHFTSNDARRRILSISADARTKRSGENSPPPLFSWACLHLSIRCDIFWLTRNRLEPKNEINQFPFWIATKT